MIISKPKQKTKMTRIKTITTTRSTTRTTTATITATATTSTTTSTTTTTTPPLSTTSTAILLYYIHDHPLQNRFDPSWTEFNSMCQRNSFVSTRPTSNNIYPQFILERRLFLDRTSSGFGSGAGSGSIKLDFQV